MKKLVVLFDHLGLMSSPFDSDLHVDGYKELHDKALKKGIKVIFARGGPAAYIGNSTFTNCSTFDEKEEVSHEDVVADIVLDKSKYFIPEDSLNCINHRRIKEICIDKILTHEKFRQFSPDTQQVANQDELNKFLQMNSERRVVLKPTNGSAGKDVIIDDASLIDPSSVEYPLLAQEFVDSSSGIEGIVDGMHDFRINVINGNIVFAFIRTPGPDSYLAGIATGGTLTPIESAKVPEELVEIKNVIDEAFSFSKARLYTIDVAYNGSEFKLIELNSQPGMLPSRLASEYNDFQESILDLVVDNI